MPSDRSLEPEPMGLDLIAHTIQNRVIQDLIILSAKYLRLLSIRPGDVSPPYTGGYNPIAVGMSLALSGPENGP